MTDLPATGASVPEVASNSGQRTGSPPPHPLDGKWYINSNGQNFGPYSGHELRAYIAEGRITSSSNVAAVGSDLWRRAADDPVLGGFFSDTRTPPPLQPNPNSRVSAAEGATVVQVTNNLAPSQPSAASVLMEGPAAPKSAGVALLLSLVISGAGQLYNGQIGKGILMFVLAIALWLVFLGWIIWIWSAVDAYQTAKAMNLRYLRILAGGHAPQLA